VLLQTNERVGDNSKGKNNVTQTKLRGVQNQGNKNTEGNLSLRVGTESLLQGPRARGRGTKPKKKISGV